MEEKNQEIDEALLRIKSKIDTSAEQLKEKLGSTVYQVEDVIESAEKVFDKMIDRVNTTASQTREVFKSAEKMAESLEDPVSLVKKYPMVALTGALLGGMALGMIVRQQTLQKRMLSSQRRLKVAP